jgi:hypothetical protein
MITQAHALGQHGWSHKDKVLTLSCCCAVSLWLSSSAAASGCRLVTAIRQDRLAGTDPGAVLSPCRSLWPAVSMTGSTVAVNTLMLRTRVICFGSEAASIMFSGRVLRSKPRWSLKSAWTTFACECAMGDSDLCRGAIDRGDLCPKTREFKRCVSTF